MLRRGIPAPRAGQTLLLTLLLVASAGCGSGRDVAEVHRRLSLRLEHRPPERALAEQAAEIRARVQSSLESPQLTA